MTVVFDRSQIVRQRERAAPHFAAHDFLFAWTMAQIADRLSIVRRSFPLCLQIGARGPRLEAVAGMERLLTLDHARGFGADILADEEYLPCRHGSLDLVVSALNLHTVNDLPGALLQVQRALRPDGLFLVALLGGETLRELRICLTEAELELYGRAAPRVAPFADKPQIGGLMQRAGFALPVVDSEIVTVTYQSIMPLLYDLRRMGEGNAVLARPRNFTPRSLFLRAGEIYAERFADADGRIRASFEIIFALGWAPHTSQPQPLRRGSAERRLADALGTSEQSPQ